MIASTAPLTKLAPGRSGRPSALAVSVAGPGHIVEGRECEDASGCDIVGSHVLVAVSDGLGSVPRGGEGAELAVAASLRAGREFIAETVLFDLDELVWEMTIGARRALEAATADPRELACTLIVCAGHGTAVATAHIGDGAVVGAHSEDLFVVSTPGHSEYVNEVEHLGQKNWLSALRISIRDPVSGFAAFTDGLQRAALKRIEDRWTPFAGFLDPLFQHFTSRDDHEQLRKEIERLLSGARLSEHSEDDKSLAFGLLGDDRR
ncbi:MAG: protein phosphatase 2C domain-containing protein [Actinobacteria bacterium]|nr:protein phosphatase 2C domain-containing protein [Actinomycetota bacterium]